MKILYAVSEAAPFVKSGGLGDVAEAFPTELAKKKDVEVSVFIPYYKSIKDNDVLQVELVKSFYVNIAHRQEYVGVFRLVNKSRKIKHYFIDNEYYFYRDKIYGYYDDGERFTYFCLAILEAMRKLDYFPDVIHCNDWQTALIPTLKKAFYSGVYDQIRTVFTIHNIEYQGKMPSYFMQDIICADEAYRGVLTYDGCLNLMKSAIVEADRITTVSKSYAEELRYAFFAHGLQDILKENGYKMRGIVNGINTDLYNPEKDPYIFANYSDSDISGKAKNKKQLQKMLALPEKPNVPIVAIVSRLAAHKGLELLRSVMDELLDRNLQIVVLGTGELEYEELFKFNAYAHSDKMSASITFSPSLASKVYAGADILLMPSKSEPCGLSQLIAMRYGTVPVVRETGGLRDTVLPLDTESLEGRGFTFKDYNAYDMLDAIDRCISFYGEKEKWNRHIKNLIRYNSNWKEPVKEYLELYNEIV